MSIKILRLIETYNRHRKHKILILFDDTFADIINNKKLYQTVTEVFIRVTKLNIPTVFITQSYFALPKDAGLNFTHFFKWKFQANKSLN